MKINIPYSLNEIGKRQNQEDSIFPAKGQADNDTRFFLVCDGMGGHENGEVASQTVCESFASILKDIRPEDFNEVSFEQTLALAYNELDKKDNTPEHKSKMGTTLTFLYLNEKEAFMAHIGDSRIYQLRTKNGKTEIIHKTFDHSLVNELLKAEVITIKEAENHPKKNIITRAIQPHLKQRYKADIHKTSDVQAGDYFFLCSDGVLESVNDKQLIEIVSENTDDETKIEAIRQLCDTHSKDNFSAYLVPVAEGFAETTQLTEETPDTEATITTPPVTEKKKKTKCRIIILLIILLVITGIGAYFFC